jgi:hypothetical protein
MGAMVSRGELSIEDLPKQWKLEKNFKPESNPYYGNKKILWDNSIKKLFT